VLRAGFTEVLVDKEYDSGEIRVRGEETNRTPAMAPSSCLWVRRRITQETKVRITSGITSAEEQAVSHRGSGRPKPLVAKGLLAVIQNRAPLGDQLDHATGEFTAPSTWATM